MRPVFVKQVKPKAVQLHYREFVVSGHKYVVQTADETANRKLCPAARVMCAVIIWMMTVMVK